MANTSRKALCQVSKRRLMNDWRSIENLVENSESEILGSAWFIDECKAKMPHLHEVGAAVALLDGEAAAGVERALERLRLVELAVPAEGQAENAQQDVGVIWISLSAAAACVVTTRMQGPCAG